jgi:flagellar motor switch protein FliN/FliY
MGQDHPHHWFGERMSSVKDVKVEISVLLGRSVIPMHQLLRMGRGAVIELDSHQEDPVLILANDRPVAKGEIVIHGDRIGVSITEILRAYQ